MLWTCYVGAQAAVIASYGRPTISRAISQQEAGFTVEAEYRAPSATVQLARFELPHPVNTVMKSRDSYWLDMCLTPRPPNTEGRFENGRRSGDFDRMGDIFMAPPGHVLHTRGDGGQQVSIVCQLNPEPINRWFDGGFEWTQRRLDAMLDIPNSAVRSLLMRLSAEVRQPGFASDVLVELITGQLAIEVARHCASVTDEPASGGLAPWRLRLIDERLAEVRDAPTLGELARLCNLSVRQLTRGFRASCGASIGDYVTRSRMECAKRLLSTDESVKSIAYSMGFASPSSFSHAFRRETGETPNHFRQRLCGSAC